VDELYAQLGRKQSQIENLHQEYMNLLQLVTRIQSGEVDPATIEITGDAWAIKINEMSEP
jgi:hypothetical protein